MKRVQTTRRMDRSRLQGCDWPSLSVTNFKTSLSTNATQKQSKTPLSNLASINKHIDDANLQSRVSGKMPVLGTKGRDIWSYREIFGYLLTALVTNLPHMQPIYVLLALARPVCNVAPTRQNEAGEGGLLWRISRAFIYTFIYSC